MTRRRLVILCHWLSFFLLTVLLIKGRGAAAMLVWSFVGISGLWVASYAVARGPLNGPGPRLTAPLRTIHRIQHHLLYLALPAASALAIWHLDSPATGRVLTVLFFTGLLHGLFHMWRHTALYDGALRRITPGVLHGVL